MSRPALNLTETAFVVTRGEFTLYGSWFGSHSRPCLALLPTNLNGANLPLVIVVDDAYMWNPDDRDSQPERAAHLIGAFLHTNNISGGSLTAQRVMSFIHDHLGDLLKIKPKRFNLEVVADAISTDADGKVTHKEIREHV